MRKYAVLLNFDKKLKFLALNVFLAGFQPKLNGGFRVVVMMLSEDDLPYRFCLNEDEMPLLFSSRFSAWLAGRKAMANNERIESFIVFRWCSNENKERG